MPRQIHRIDGVKPSPVLSHVVEANGFVFLAGTVGSDPATETVKAGGFEAECRQMLDNVGQLLRGVGLDFGDVVRSTVYLVDFANRDTYNRVYREYFSADPPARATVQVGLTAPYTIEIECTAARRA
jgi:2-iminobutanoate/2-iminopropanoate deaminase